MKLHRIYSSIIPFWGNVAITFCPWMIIREELKKKVTPTVSRHEATHALQQIETLWIMFFILYGVEYLIKLLCTFSHNKAYLSISFEQEAYNNQGKISYNDTRKHYAWVKYIFKLSKKK